MDFEEEDRNAIDAECRETLVARRLKIEASGDRTFHQVDIASAMRVHDSRVSDGIAGWGDVFGQGAERRGTMVG